MLIFFRPGLAAQIEQCVESSAGLFVRPPSTNLSGQRSPQARTDRSIREAERRLRHQPQRNGGELLHARNAAERSRLGKVGRLGENDRLVRLAAGLLAS